MAAVKTAIGARSAANAARPPVQHQQMSLPELEDLLDQSQGKLRKLPIYPDDIGGELLAILSKGLYTNPLDCIREYVQNAVDAQARNVTIKITGNSVLISDDGTGMGLSEILRARQFGLSGKSLSEHVGFRGIGIYSAFDLCQRLRITSKRADEQRQHVLMFEFAAMRQRLETDRQRGPDAQKTSLIDLLSDHTQVGRQPLAPTVPLSRQYTIVELQDISDVHIRELSNRTELRRYLLENLPIDFDDTFDHRRAINDLLYAHVQGYNAIKITLQSDGIADEVVAKAAIPNLQAPMSGYIVTTSTPPKQVAYYWACMNSERQGVDDNLKKEREPRAKDRTEKAQVSEDLTSYEGFVYKVKGFTVGDRQKLRPMFRRKSQLYSWYTGEIYVLDNAVIPNAERDDFETNAAKRSLTIAVGEKLKELEGEVEGFQARGVADKRVADSQQQLAELERAVATGTHQGDFEAFSLLDQMVSELSRQRKKASNPRAAEDLIKGAKTLQRRLRREVDDPSPIASRRKQAARNPTVAQRAMVPLIDTVPPPAPKSLPAVMQEAGWSVDGDVARLAELVQAALEDVLGKTSTIYRNLLNDLEARLQGDTADE